MKLHGLFGSVFLMLVMATPAFAQGVHGVFTVVKGDIQVESGKDKKVQKARVGAKVFATDTITSGKDSRAKIEMSDKNIINISPDSKLMIEKYENAGGKKEVLLNVLQGKVRPSVTQKYDGENEKFHVKTPSAVAGVRGTDFMVSYNPGTRASQVVTFAGQVDVGSKVDVGGKIMNPVSVMPGQFTTSSATQAPAPPAAMPQEQLKQMNRETVAEPAQNAAAPPSGAPAPGADKKPEDGGKEKQDVKTEPKTEPKAEPKSAGPDKGPAARSPANAPGRSGPSMAPNSGDLTNTSPNGEPPRMPDSMGSGMPVLPTIQAPVQYINPDIIQNNGNSKVLIRISSPAN